MTSSDEHLEQSLNEYNMRITVLESTNDKLALVDALTYRSTILLLLESFVSSITDVEDALVLCDELVSEGKKVDPGILIKLHENRGQLCFDSDVEQMVSDYDAITELLCEVGDSAKHYERKELVTMCLDCAADLVDKEMYRKAVPFADKALKVIGDSKEEWELNYAAEALNIIGQASKEDGDCVSAKENFLKAVNICTDLGNNLDDRMELAFAYVNLGDMAQDERNIPDMIKYHEEAVKVLTEMNDDRKLDDVKILTDLHQGLAAILMDSGEVERAEKHLIAAMALGLPEMKETMDNLGISKKI